MTATAARSAPETHPDGRTLVAFAALVVLVASNIVAVRFINRELPPFWGAGTRFLIASGLFFVYVRVRHIPLPRGRALVGTLIFGALQFGLGFALAYWSLLEVPAGLAAVILALIPLLTLVFAFIARIEALRLRGVLGSLLALAGVAAMFGERAGGDIPIPYLLASVGTAAAFALALVVVKAFPPVHPAAQNAIAMLTGSLMLLGLSLASGETAAIPRAFATWAAQIYLILPGSLGVFGLLLFVLGRWTATGLSYQTVLTPPVAVGLSAWLLNEPVTEGLLVGATLVLLGVYVGAIAPRSRERRGPWLRGLRPSR